MNKKIKLLVYSILVFCVMQSKTLQVFAEEFTGSDDWSVEFTQDKKMESNFSTGSFVDVLDYLQPGDSAGFQVRIQNSCEDTTDWYMSNKILKSLEDGSITAASGGYSYVLTYTATSGEKTVLYNSETIGGENFADDAEGLHEATTALKDYFYLDTLNRGQTGLVELFIRLDGETQGNDYQDTLAQLQLDFAVELSVKTSSHKEKIREEEKVAVHYEQVQDEDVYVEDNTSILNDDDVPRTFIVKTGDDTRLIPLFVTAGVLGIILMIVAVWAIHLRKQIGEE